MSLVGLCVYEDFSHLGVLQDLLDSQTVFPDKQFGLLSWWFGQQEDFHGKVLPSHVEAELREVWSCSDICASC